MAITAKKKNILFAVISLFGAALLLGFDQLTKYWVLKDLKPIGSITLIPGWLEFTYVENRGAAFGMLQNQYWLLVTITAVVSAIIVFLLFTYKHHSFFSYAACAMVIAGGIGNNLLDRVMYGFVVDFIHVMFFDYVFNFADCCITVSAVFFVIHVLFFWKEKGKTETEEVRES